MEALHSDCSAFGLCLTVSGSRFLSAHFAVKHSRSASFAHSVSYRLCAIRSDPRSHAAHAARADYQRQLRRKQSQFSRSQAIALLAMAQDNPARFWGKFKVAKKRACAVPDAAMVDYFRELLGQEPVVSSDMHADSTADAGAAPPAADGAELNVPFTTATVTKGIQSLHGGKATVGALRLDALSAADAELAPCLA